MTAPPSRIRSGLPVFRAAFGIRQAPCLDTYIDVPFAAAPHALTIGLRTSGKDWGIR
jgi:hypothetical protein